MVTLPCPICQRPGVLQSGGAKKAEQNGVAVTCNARPIVACEQGHAAVPNAARQQAHQALAGRVPTAKRSWRGVESCRLCRTPLRLPARWTQIPVTVETPLLITLTCEVPATRCPNCGVDSLPSQASKDLACALDDVFRD